MKSYRSVWWDHKTQTFKVEETMPMARALTGRGFVVLVDDVSNAVEEYGSVQEAQDEAARLYVQRSRNCRVILYAPVAVLTPKLDPNTEIRFTPFAEKLKLVPEPDAGDRKRLSEVEGLVKGATTAAAGEAGATAGEEAH